MEFKNITITNQEKKENINSFALIYKEYLNQYKTEYEWAGFAIHGAKNRGYSNFKENKDNNKFYIDNKNSCMLFRLNKDNNGNYKPFNIIVSHIDSPRIDLKSNPLYEDKNLALFKTHYYGGIKTYQWSCIPLEMRGLIYLSDGRELDCKDLFKDKTFMISDILPHLSHEQDKRETDKAIKGEELNILVGSEQIDNKDVKDKICQTILNILKSEEIDEEDFATADIRFVPKLQSSFIGFDDSLIGGYGQDDRVCAYTALEAFYNSENINENSVMLILADKEEVGSDGTSGMRGNWWYNYLKDIADYMNVPITKLCRDSFCISADVDGAIDPTFSDPFEPNNACYINRGITIEKDGASSGGKYDASECPGHLANKLRILFKNNNINYQICEMGNMDMGAGGTVAQFIANKGINVIDCGVPVLSMHSPFEITSKYDVYETYLAYKVFYEKWS